MIGRRMLAGVSGALFGIAFGLPVGDGHFARFGLAATLMMGIIAVIRVLAPVERRTTLAMAGVAAYALHVAVASALTTASVALGRSGFITSDDAAYARLAWSFVELLRGRPIEGSVPPYWGGDAYLFGTWVYLEAAVFAVFGFDVLAPLFVNAALATVLAVLMYDTALRLFGGRAAIAAVVLSATYPSLVLWSSLHLKDTLAAMLVGLALWSLLRFQLQPRWPWLLLAFAVLVPMESVRRYAFVGLALTLPVGVAAAAGLRPMARLWWTSAALAASVVALVGSQAGISLGPSLLSNLEFTRQQMSLGARTGFVEAPPLVARAGDTFVVGMASPSPDARVVHIPLGARFVVEDAAAGPASTAGPDVVRVRPGEIVVFGPTSATAAPPEARRPLPSAAAVRLADAPDDGAIVGRTAAYLPVGLAYALFAPFPWSASRTLDLVVVPEMLLWYAILLAALRTLWLERRRPSFLLPLTLYLGGTLLLFALAQGNTGTLFRHRGMIIPFAIVLAAPQFAAFAVAVARRVGLLSPSGSR